MKKIILSLFLCAVASMAMAFDWKPQSNEKLRSDMIEYAESFMQLAKGSPAEKMLKDFVKRQKSIAEKQPYAWIAETHELVVKLKAMYPPKIDDGEFEAMMRRGTLRLLDYPLHVDNHNKEISDEERNTFNEATSSYLASTRQQALDWLKKPAPEPGKIEICLVYNMGCFIRTSERTFAMDICWKGTQEEAKVIADAIDVIFVSHPHQDHYTPFLLQAVADAGKPIVSPARSLPGFDSRKIISLNYTNFDPITIAGIDIRLLHGAQEVGENDSIPNNVYMIHFDGWTLLNQGENENVALQLQLPVWPLADIVIAPSWNQIQYLLAPVMRAQGADKNPPLFLPLHQNEMGHTVRHRESYWELFNREDRLGNKDFNYPPFVLIDNGESIVYSK